MTDAGISRTCPRCGSDVAADDRYCPRCGEALFKDPHQRSEHAGQAGPSTAQPAATATTHAPIPAKERAGRLTWLWVLISLGVVAVLAFVLLTVFPLGEESVEREEPDPAIVDEGSPEDTGTIVEIGQEPDSEAPERRRDEVDQEDSREPWVNEPARDRAAPPEGTYSEAQSVAILLEWVRENDHYPVLDSCIEAGSQGYSNRGFTIVLRASGCENRSGVLGTWRVDTLTGEVYEQKPDGRFLSP